MTTKNDNGAPKGVYESLQPIVFLENDSNDYLAALNALMELKLSNPIHRSHTVTGLMDYLARAHKAAAQYPTALPCLVVMELKLPQIGGLEGQAMIRGHTHFRSIPIVAMSGADRLGALQRAVTLGANGFLIKPFEATCFRKLAADLCLPLTFGNTPR